MRYFDTVTILTPGSKTDRYNNTVVDWTTATSADSSAWVGPTSTNENLATGDKLVLNLSCHLPPDVTVTAACRIEWRGDTYEIDGDLLPYSRRGVLHHYECALKRVRG